ncbi:MAG: hypothetical protein ACK4S4_15730 [Pyrinomonadaceae bacterium]
MNETEKIETGSAQKPARWIVRHFGLNRAARRHYQRVARTNAPGSKANLDARRYLDLTPQNQPIRKILIDDRATYLFEPQFFAGQKAYREAFNRRLAEIAALPEEERTNAENLTGVGNPFMVASKAFFEAISAFLKNQTAEANG